MKNMRNFRFDGRTPLKRSGKFNKRPPPRARELASLFMEQILATNVA